MRITLVIFGSIDGTSGGYRYDRELVAAAERAGHAVKVIGQPNDGRYGHQRRLARDPKWLRAIVASNPDLVLIDELNHAAWPAPVLARLREGLRGTALVALVHHLRSDEVPVRPRARLWERSFLRGVDGWLCNSRTTLARVSAVAGVKRSSAVAYPGRESDVVRERTGHGTGPVHIVALGSLTPRKNLVRLIKAFGELQALQPARLTIAGDATLDPGHAAKLQALAGRSGGASAIAFAGHLTRDDLDRLIDEADIFALPSLFEGFGIVYLEAMAAGLPVLGGARGAAAEAIGDCGRVVNPYSVHAIRDALIELVGDGELRERLGRCAQARAALFPTWQVSMEGAVRALEQFRSDAGLRARSVQADGG